VFPDVNYSRYLEEIFEKENIKRDLFLEQSFFATFNVKICFYFLIKYFVAVFK